MVWDESGEEMKKIDVEPLVSVIVPVYNVEKYLDRCMESIVGQTYKNLEIILVDDGSTDNSGKMCDEWGKKDKRVRVFHKENGGLSDARNYGLDRMKGEYVCFVDSDDDVASDYVGYLLSLVRKYNSKMSTAQYAVIGQSGKVVKPASFEERLLNEGDALESLLAERYFTVSANAKLYAAELCQKIKFPKGKLCEDNGTTYKFIMGSGKVACGGKVVYSYYKNPDSIMGKKFTDDKMDLVELVDRMCEEVVKKFPGLAKFAEMRRIEARFSVLRQMYVVKLNRRQSEEARAMRAFILERKGKILTSSIYSKRDKVAVLALLFGGRFFGFCWKIYNGVRY